MCIFCLESGKKRLDAQVRVLKSNRMSQQGKQRRFVQTSKKSRGRTRSYQKAMSRKAQSPQFLRPEEWDFRLIKEDQLCGALYYEYARSADWVRETFKKWHEQRIFLTKDSEYFRRWNGKKVEDVLNQLAADNLPPDVGVVLHNSMPDSFSEDPLDDIFWIAGFQFPTPFLKLPSIDPENFRHRDSHYPKRQPGFTLVEPKIHLMKALLAAQTKKPKEKAMVHNIFLAQVNLSASETKIINDFKNWLETLPLAEGSKAQAHSLPWHELKELAAFRLQEVAGLTYREAQEQLRLRERSTHIEAIGDVFPIYSKGGFSDAVACARNRIEALFPFRS